MDLHIAPRKIKVPPKSHLLVGLDFGLTPAATIGLPQSDGSLIIVDELISTRSGALQFGSALKNHIRENYSNRVELPFFCGVCCQHSVPGMGIHHRNTVYVNPCAANVYTSIQPLPTAGDRNEILRHPVPETPAARQR